MSERVNPAPASLAKPIALQGRVAIVTGGAQGIGWHIAAALAEAGATVVIADINEGPGEAAARRLQERGATAMAHRWPTLLDGGYTAW